MSKNKINTWVQGRFVYKKEYDHMPEGWKNEREYEEKLLVRNTRYDGEVICRAVNQENAEWIAKRLNIATDILKKVRDLACEDCNGSGAISTPSAYGPCSACEGTGFSNNNCTFNDTFDL